MYPANYVQLFPAFPRNPRVFVAMSFAPEFERRWEGVIAPAIRRVKQDGVLLEPHRVDTRVVSDSILTEILDGITHDSFILADISTLHGNAASGQRNPNVMYEVGIAHALRLPEEVLLFRSDEAPLLFDVANIRVNRFDPDHDPEKAMDDVTRALVNAGNEVNLQRLATVKHVPRPVPWTRK